MTSDGITSEVAELWRMDQWDLFEGIVLVYRPDRHVEPSRRLDGTKETLAEVGSALRQLGKGSERNHVDTLP